MYPPKLPSVDALSAAGAASHHNPGWYGPCGIAATTATGCGIDGGGLTIDRVGISWRKTGLGPDKEGDINDKGGAAARAPVDRIAEALLCHKPCGAAAAVAERRGAA